jgi:hypothetical protein
MIEDDDDEKTNRAWQTGRRHASEPSRAVGGTAAAGSMMPHKTPLRQLYGGERERAEREKVGRWRCRRRRRGVGSRVNVAGMNRADGSDYRAGIAGTDPTRRAAEIPLPAALYWAARPMAISTKVPGTTGRRGRGLTAVAAGAAPSSAVAV